jgi:DNA mismatch endonuclease (patch repair protein)
MDSVSAQIRSRMMSRIRSKDTQPELLVRRYLHAAGYRYRLHVSSLPGKPDLVFPQRRVCVFVHGCFWHRHNCQVGRRSPKSKKKYWLPKLQGNKERHKKNRRILQKQGWRVLTVWECQTKKPEKLIGRIADFLKKS